MKLAAVKYQLLVLVLLVMASVIGVVLVSGRYAYTNQYAYFFLLWNLFLAWIPLIFALLARTLESPKLQAKLNQKLPLRLRAFALKPFLLISTGGWLLFFPNAPYIVTDLMHLNWKPNHLLWFDSVMLIFFALTGLLLGFVSLYLMQGVVRKHLGAAASWLFVLVSLALSSYGIYIGRFLRWNSWDILFNPRSLLRDMAYSFIEPRMFAITLVLTCLFSFTYIILMALPHLALEPQLALNPNREWSK